MKTNLVTLIEQSSGWVHAQHGEEFKTLAGAFRYVQRDAKRIASGCGILATQIEYLASTDRGYREVQQLLKNQS